MARLEINIQGAGITQTGKEVSGLNDKLKSLQTAYERTGKAVASLYNQSHTLQGELKRLNNDFKAGTISETQFNNETKRVGLELSSVSGKIQTYQNNMSSLSATMNQLTDSSRSFGTEQKKLQAYSNDFTGGIRSANTVAVEFSRIIQDAPYGMQGVANNIQQLTQNWGYYSQAARTAAAASGQVLTTKQLLRGALGAMLSPMNLLTLGISAITAGWVAYERYQQRANKAMRDGSKAAKDYAENLNNMSTALYNASKSYNDDIAKMKTLTAVLNDGNSSLIARETALKDLQSMYPAVFKNYDIETIKTQNATDAYNELAESIIAAANASAARGMIAEKASKQWALYLENDQIKEQINLLDEQISRQEKLTGTPGRAVGGVAEAIESGNISRENKLLKEKDDLQQKETKNREDHESLQEEINKLTKVAISNQQQVNGELLDQSKNTERVSQSTKDYLDLLDRVFDSGRHKSNIINSANPELQKVRNEYQKLFDDIDRIEKKALADKKITEAQKTEAVQSAIEKRKQIAQAQAIAENDILYKQGTASLEKSLQEQYSLWQKYEDWRKNVSIESANERYKNELDAIKGFETKIHSEVAGLLSKALTPIGINESEAKRLEMLSGLLKSYYTQQENENDKYLQNLLTTYEGYEAKRKNLAKDYAKDMANISGEEAAMRTGAYEEALRRLWDSQIAGSDVFKELDIQLDFGSLASAKKALKTAKAFVDDLFKNLNPTNAQEAKAAAELKKGIDKALSGIDRGLSEKTYDVVVDLAGEFETLVNSAMEFDGTMKTALRSISNMVGAVGSVAKSLGSVMGESGKGLMNMGGWAGVAGAAISIVGGIFESIERKREQREKEREERLKYAEDYRIKQLNLQTSILQKQANLINEMYGVERIEAYANVLNGINKEQERLLKIQQVAGSRPHPDEFINAGRSKILQNTGIKEVDEWIVRYNKALTSVNASERQWAGQILPQIQREAKKAGITIKELGFDLRNLSQMEAVELESLIDAGAFDEATSKFLQTILDLWSQEAEAIKLLKQELTGTTFESIADGLVDIFTRGDNALEDFEKNFDELMRKSLIQSLKRSIMSDALKRWYDDFADFSQDGLDEAEIAGLRNSYAAIGEQIKANAENLEKATGISLSSDTGSSDGSTMQGRISRAITEATGSQILGFERAKFDIDRNQLALLTAVFMPGGTNILQTTNNILSDSLDALNLIEENTFNTVEELKKSVAQLTAINKNTVTRLSRD